MSPWGRHGTIAGRKAAQDSKRAAMFTKYARVITVAAKAGGDPEYNATLRLAIEKAKAISMPNDNITRAIKKKGTGELAGETYEELSFEGYGVGGVAVIVEALTDNTNRTTSSVRSTFDKYGGNLGTTVAVSYMFSRRASSSSKRPMRSMKMRCWKLRWKRALTIWSCRRTALRSLPIRRRIRTCIMHWQIPDMRSWNPMSKYVPSMEAAPKDEHDIAKLAKMIEPAGGCNDDVQKSIYKLFHRPFRGITDKIAIIL